MTDAHLAYTRQQNLNIAMTINNYWRLPVASVNSHHEVYSSLSYGVPREAKRHKYKHDCIIWVHRSAEGKWMVRKE